MSATDTWATIEDLADFLQVDEMPEFGSELALAAAHQAVRKYMDQDVTLVEDDVEIHDGRGRPRLRLRQRPVREVTSIEVNGEALGQDDWTISRAVLVRRNGTWTPGYQNIHVTYTHGWDAMPNGEFVLPVPADIKLVTLSAARRHLLSQGQQDDDIVSESESLDTYSHAYTKRQDAAASEDLLLAEQAVLDRYRI